jgi:hypothetical protein
MENADAFQRKQNLLISIKINMKTKLSKFQFERLTVAETNAIKAGSGTTLTQGGSTSCSGTDHDNGNPDSD